MDEPFKVFTHTCHGDRLVETFVTLYSFADLNSVCLCILSKN